jgi:hypothetical protein
MIPSGQNQAPAIVHQFRTHLTLEKEFCTLS